MKRVAAVLACLVLAAALPAWADPPGRVARLSVAEGEVAVFADPEQGWEGARINSHLTSENSVWAAPGGRAEVRYGATALRLGETTQLDIVRLDDETLRAHLARGSLGVRIRQAHPGETFHIGTPHAGFELRGNGRYRIDSDPERGESRLVVFSGSARLEATGGSISIDTGRSVRVYAGEQARFAFEPADSTALDEWALARDRRLEEREAARYVPQEMTGWEDLDDHGVWRNEPEYGVVWYPTRVEAGWAPYRYGRWTWVRPWGWAWVDDAPWGYAPFHYGRWVYAGNRWGWYPGRYTTRPVWAPALVGWVGRPGWSVSISAGFTDVVGWYPLSPYDNYQPWYTTNVTYVTNVNRIVMPPRRDRGRHDGRGDGRGNGHGDDRGDGRRDQGRDGRYDNRDRGATVVPRDQFGSRRPVNNVLAPVPRDVVAAQPTVPGTAVLPSRSEWRTRNRPAETASPPVAPQAPSRVQPPAGAMPTSPLAPAPSTRPGAVPQAAPSYAAPPASPPSRYTRPAPAEPAPRAKPPAPRTGVIAPSPAKPVPAQQASKPEPVPSTPSKPVAKPMPVQSMPSQPVAKPAPSAEKPGAKPPAQERPARGGDKPADPGGGG